MATKDKGGEPAKKVSRYELVKRYLDAANEGSCSDYQGYGRFWNLPLAEFLEVTIYGVRMIAPPSEDFSQLTPREVAEQGPITTETPDSDPAAEPSSGGSCCHSSCEPPTPTSDAGRGARSCR